MAMTTTMTARTTTMTARLTASSRTCCATHYLTNLRDPTHMQVFDLNYGIRGPVNVGDWRRIILTKKCTRKEVAEPREAIVTYAVAVAVHGLVATEEVEQFHHPDTLTMALLLLNPWI